MMLGPSYFAYIITKNLSHSKRDVNDIIEDTLTMMRELRLRLNSGTKHKILLTQHNKKLRIH